MAKELSDRWILQLRDELVTRVSARAMGCDIELTGSITVSSDASVRFRDATQVGLAKAESLPAEDIRRLIGAEGSQGLGKLTSLAEEVSSS